MKKIIIASTLIAAMTMSGQVDAAEKQTVQVDQVQVEQGHIFSVDQKIKKVLESCNLTMKYPQKQEQPKDVDNKEHGQVEEPKVPQTPEISETPQIPQAPETVEKEQIENNTSTISQEEQQMVDLVNAERSKQGLAPLKVNEQLVEVARVKAEDMIAKNYFDHQSPTYGSPFEMMKQFGVTYRTSGENLAGNQSVQSAHQALMNSDGHRANILGNDYTEIGIGIIDGGPYGKMFVQLFKG